MARPPQGSTGPATPPASAPGAPAVASQNERYASDGHGRGQVALPWLWQARNGQSAQTPSSNTPADGAADAQGYAGPKHTGAPMGVPLTQLLGLAVALDVVATTTWGLEATPVVLSELAARLVALRGIDATAQLPTTAPSHDAATSANEDAADDKLARVQQLLAELAALVDDEHAPRRDRMAQALLHSAQTAPDAPRILARAHPEAVLDAMEHVRALAAVLCCKAELAIDGQMLRRQLRP